MHGKVIDFDKSKQKLLKKMYPNVRPIIPTNHISNFTKTNQALNKFKEIFYEYEKYINEAPNSRKIDLEEVLVYFNRFFDTAFEEMINAYDLKGVPKFREAIDYSMLNGGKRLRPFLITMTYYFSLGSDFIVLTPLLVAMELIHTFSLIHDDLPCMDNDEIRRGKPTVWKKYGEDMAVLVGDALLTEASNILLETIFEFAYTELGSYIMSSAVILMRLAGLDGMITGQVFDVINTNNKELTLKDINFMYSKKTAALITASIVIGANMSAKYNKNLSYVEELGMNIGESYQIKDDLLEIEGTTEKIGKSTNSDQANHKITYVSLTGVKEAKNRLSELYARSLTLIDLMTDKDNIAESKVYKEVINYILLRDK